MSSIVKKPPLPDLAPELEARGQKRLDSFLKLSRQAGCEFQPDSDTAEALKRAFVFSQFVYRCAKGNPRVLTRLLESGNLWEKHDAGRLRQLLAEELEACESEDRRAVLFSGLRRYRRTQMLRIAIVDLAGRKPLEDVLEEVSLLAEVCLQKAVEGLFEILTGRFGRPLALDDQPAVPVVLALGKLGGRELNFSSDIDLVFAYSAEGRTSCDEVGPGISNEEFFQRLFRDLIQLIGSSSSDGFVFRVDTRLRPYGQVGPLAMSFGRMEDYYQRQGREWERYALIKARAVAGNLESGQKLLERLKPFVYRRYLDYGVFEELREMKAKIMAEVKAKGLQNDIKLGPGGIREIEFFGQVFQLLRGGVQPAYQQRSIQATLRRLADYGAVDRRTMTQLLEAYRFLRTVENRLQQWEDHQTHKLPTDARDRLRLACSMGFSALADFETQLDRHRHLVQRRFDMLLDEGGLKRGHGKVPGVDENILEQICRGRTDSRQAADLLGRLGYGDPDKVLETLAGLRKLPALKRLSQAGRIKLNKLLPLFLTDVAANAGSQPELVFRRLMELLASIQGRVPYLSLLIESATARLHLIRLTAASSWIARFVARHPVLLDELIDPRTLYEPATRESLKKELERQMAAIDPDDLEQQMDALRVFQQVNTLRVAAADITDVLPLMKVSDRLSDLAETILEKVLELCWEQLVAKHGRPGVDLDGQACDRGFVVVAYGKLGGLELGYGSDLDLVFLHAAAGGTTDGPRPVDNTHFYTRLGQRVLHMLTAHTAAGILYQADMRLRPSGDSGLLVSRLESFRRYQLEDAWTWEHQALVRARAVVGDPALKQAFEKIRRRVMIEPRDAKTLLARVTEMRGRLRKAQDRSSAGEFDLKQGFGGIVDIEFLVQYLVLRNASRFPELARWTDNVRLLQSLATAGIIDQETAYLLRRAYLIYRAMAHRCNLQERPVLVTGGHFDGLRAAVQSAWRRFMV